MRSETIPTSFLLLPRRPASSPFGCIGALSLLAAGLLGCGEAAEDPVNNTDGLGGEPTTAPELTSTSPSMTSTSGPVASSPTTPPTGPGPEVTPTPTTPAPDVTSPTPTSDPTPDPTPDPTQQPTPDPTPTGTGMVDPPPVTGGDCSFTVNHELSSAISTVGIVTWSVDMTVEQASIEFGPVASGPTMSAPVDLTEDDYRTLLLGMKGDSDYVFRIVAQGGGQTCSSEDYTLTTGPVPNNVPLVRREVQNENAASRGFIVTSAGLGNLGGFPGGGGGGGSPMFIFDTDGDIVWWADAPGNCSRALMDWEGKNMWMTALNYPQSGGEMRRVSMDGLDTQSVPELANNHHDFTVAPGGVVTSISYQNGCDAIIERSPDGNIKTVVSSTATLYQAVGGFGGGGGLGGGGGGGGECHGNAITYQADDDTYVLSDRNPNLFVRFTRDGTLLWQFGGSNPMGEHFTGTWSVNHGHHLLPDGHFVFFNNESGNSSPIREFMLDEQSGMASEVWSYSGSGGSATLGDVQRLSNGNTLVTYSNSGTLVEITPNKMPAQTFTTDSLGYAMFRESLYGPPPK